MKPKAPSLTVKMKRLAACILWQTDILFGVSVEGTAELIRRRVATTHYVLCASPKYLKKHGRPKKPSDLIKHHYITHSIRKPDNLISFKDGKLIEVLLEYQEQKKIFILIINKAVIYSLKLGGLLIFILQLHYEYIVYQ